MNYIEINEDLFKQDKRFHLTQCVSADAGDDMRAMGLGIAVEFNKRFDMKNKLRKYANTHLIEVGNAILIDQTFNLITKEVYYGKPTNVTMHIALKSLKKIVEEQNVKYLAMPKIGSGLDKLKWIDVSGFIQNIFKDVDIEIKVCKGE